MSNQSEKQSGSGSSETTAEPKGTDSFTSESVGASAPATAQSSGSAGGSGSQQSRFDSSDELLVEAVRSLVSRGANPFAAGVYGRMRQLDPTFTYADAGYTSFRAFLNDAVSRGLVTLTPAPRGSDVVIEEASGDAAGVGILRSLRKDVWEAFVDWSDDANYAFARETGQVVHPEAPEQVDGKEIVRIPSAKRSEHVAWMKHFAQLESSDSLRATLLAGLADPEPTRAFARLLQEHAPTARRWKRYLRTRILGRATTWAIENDIRASAIEPTVPTATAASGPSRTVRTRSEDADTRERILAILADLPLSELLQLRIPAEYALRR